MTNNSFGLSNNYRVSSALEEYMREIGMEIYIEYGPENEFSPGQEYNFITTTVVHGKTFCSSGSSGYDKPLTSSILRSEFNEVYLYEKYTYDELLNHERTLYFTPEGHQQMGRLTRFMRTALLPDEFIKLRDLVAKVSHNIHCLWICE